MRDLLSTQLGRRGFEVETAADGEDALAKVRHGDFDLVISDVKMPRLGGIELLEAIRSSSPDVAVVMLTGYGTVGEAVDAMKLGAFDFIEKPFDVARLMAAVDRALEKRELESLRRESRILSASNAFLESFAEYAAHDMAAPLCQVASVADILERTAGAALGAEHRELLANLRSSAERGAKIVQAVLELARTASHAGVMGRCEGAALARAALAELAPLVRETGAEVTIGPLPAFRGDSVLIERLFVNLLKNAMSYAKPHQPPKVVVSASQRQDGSLELRVADEGIGFDEADLGRIFRPFVRLGPGTGTGMGLAMCARIAERHGGTITARSRPGEGAAFVVTLPANH